MLHVILSLSIGLRATPPLPPIGEERSAVLLDVLAAPEQHDAWPRPCGITLPQPFLNVGERPAVLEHGGVERAARITPWVAARDGTPRLVRLELDELPRDVRRLELRSSHAAATATRLRCDRDGGALRFRGSADDGAIEWKERTLAVVAGATRLELGLGALGIADDGDERRPRCGAPRLLGPDAAGAEIALPLNYEGDDEARLGLTVETRVSLPSSAKVAELEIALTAPRDLLIRQLVLRGRIVGGTGELCRGSEAVRPDKRGVRRTVESGLVGVLSVEALAAACAPLALRAGEGHGRVELSWPDFGLARPSGALLRPDGSFALDLIAEPLLVHHGQTLRRTLRLARGERVGRGGARAFVVARDGQAGLDEPTLAWLAPWKEFLARWLGRPRRIDDRGCYREPWGALANGEYDLGGSLLWLGATTRDGAFLAIGEAIARHTLDWDRGIPTEAPRGLFFQHGDDHASGAVEAGHQWVGGAVGLARATGSLAALDAGRGLVNGLVEWRQESARFAGPERRLAWPLRIAAEMAESVSEPAADGLGAALVRELMSRQGPGGWLDGDRRPTRDGPRVWINTWVSLGITVESLLRAERRWPGQGARAAASKLARFVAEEGLGQDGLAEVLLVDQELGAVAESRGRCQGGEAAMAAAGLAWLARSSGDLRLAGAAATLREQARAALAAPSENRMVGLAQALLALRFERELLEPDEAGPGAKGQSLSSPSSLRGLPPREKR